MQLKLIPPSILLLSFCLLAPGARAADEAAGAKVGAGVGTEAGQKADAAVAKVKAAPAKAKAKGDQAAAEKPSAKNAEKKTTALPRADGLVIEDEVVGKGKEAKLGSKITVHYRGTLASNGQEFDSSYKRNEPISFDLLEGRLIKGWTEGIPGMKVGGKRKLHIPWPLAYGERGTPGGPIGPKADLDFVVELKAVN